MKKIKIYEEFAYLFATVFLAFAVAMISTTGFGMSMIVSPAYILSQKVSFLTFGQSEYVVQGIMFVVFCILMKKVKLIYLSSFITGLIYGAVLDLWQIVIPHFNPDITPVGSLPFALRVVYFVLGMVLTSFTIAIYFKVYLYPQIYDFFVKGVSEKFGIKLSKFKTAYDLAFLVISVIMSLVLFGEFVGVGIGTLIMAVCNGTIIGFSSKLLDKYCVFEPRFKKLSKYFEI